MSESFRERVKRMERLMNQLSDYEKEHELEWCPISDEMLKEMYPGECDSQEDRDRKADSMPSDEFEILFDATMARYRKLKKKKKLHDDDKEEEEEEEEKEVEQDNEDEQQQVIVRSSD